MYMGTGSGVSGLNSRVFTNSYAYQVQRAYYPYSLTNQGDSFAGLTRAQYASNTYYNLSYNGAGAGSGGRIARFGNPTLDYNIRFGLN